MAARILRLSFPVQQEPVVTECLKADPAVGQFYVFRHGTMVNALSPDPPESQEICRIEFQVEGKRVSHAIKSLRQIGLGASFGDIDVAPLSCSTQTLPHTRRSERCCRSFAARMPTLEIHAAIVGGSHLTAEHVLLIVLASIMAACGLLTDNLVLILASFFISPLMSMIVAATWGLVVGDGRLCVRGLRNTLLGMLLCLASGTCIALLLSVQPDAAGLEAPLGVGPGVYRAISINTVQILERGPPAAEPLLIALLVGSMSGQTAAPALRPPLHTSSRHRAWRRRRRSRRRRCGARAVVGHRLGPLGRDSLGVAAAPCGQRRPHVCLRRRLPRRAHARRLPPLRRLAGLARAVRGQRRVHHRLRLCHLQAQADLRAHAALPRRRRRGL
eukprot:Transcript_23199.p1 GENE.Transcript_23199~~Transcript_23199.p1  ORF type:complete len:387 (-),score=92.12 Transcript_23199:338-1498(-)